MAIQRIIHPDGEAVEGYALGRLDEAELGHFEEHLLWCSRCQRRLDETTEFIAVVREAARLVAMAPPRESALRRWLCLDWLVVPVTAMAGALLCIVAIVVWQPWQSRTPLESQTVNLSTLRGEATEAVASARTALSLRLDVSGIPPGVAVGQIVSTSGRILAEHPVVIASANATINVRDGLTVGQYWLRLKQDGETVREFALVVVKR